MERLGQLGRGHQGVGQVLADKFVAKTPILPNREVPRAVQGALAALAALLDPLELQMGTATPGGGRKNPFAQVKGFTEGCICGFSPVLPTAQWCGVFRG